MSTKTVAAILTLICMCYAPLAAQETRGTITGRVVDSTGAVVAGAEVRAINRETGSSSTGRTNESGNYSIPYLVPGTYDFSAGFAGFKRIERRDVQVHVNDVLKIDFSLEIGNTTETIEVKAGTPLLETANVSLGQVVEERQRCLISICFARYSPP